jgi:holo-[acyl-carrier protein] synthase
VIRGIGTDIIEVKRIEAAINRQGQRFLDHIFSSEEQAYCLRYRDAARHFAGRFAAKEAVAKALSTGFRYGIGWLDIEISNSETGQPYATLSLKLNELAGWPSLHLSISHCHDYATAFVVCTAGNEKRL